MLKDVVNTINKSDTIWVIENEENRDSIFKEYITDKLATKTYCIISKDIAYIFVHKLDEENVKVIDKKYGKTYVYDTVEKLIEYMREVIEKIGYPKNVLLSYTTIGDTNTDIITYSGYKRIKGLLDNVYEDNKYSIHSAENIIYNIISTLNSNEQEKLSVLQKITDKVLEDTFKKIKIGKSEKEIQSLVLETLNNVNFKEYGIVDYSVAWDNAPIVLIGENLESGGHSLPSDKKLDYGDTIYFDFGIKGVFEDGTILYTDIQRMGYKLKKEEKDAPENIKKVFNTLLLSIDNGIDKMRDKVAGYEVDDVVRDTITKENYPDYPHASGHPVGHRVHGGGAVISKKSKRSSLRLVENGVYTLEPRIAIKNGGSIEEMILVTKDGAKIIGNRQSKLYLV